MTSWMARELAEAPEVVSRMLAANRDACLEVAHRLRARPPAVVVTCGRGSSGHAATLAKMLIETRTGIPVASAAPSVTSVYGRRLALEGQVVLVVSQSGRSPDLVAFAEQARAAGATVIVIVNDPLSPLASLGDVCLPLHAGPERSVAATKTHIASLAAVVQIVSAWVDDELATKLEGLPEDLRAGIAADWSHAVDPFKGWEDAMVVGRGFGLGAAQEAALKLKETCGIHAEAISAAELQHGPMALVRQGYPVLAFSQDDETRSGIDAWVASLRHKGADVWVAEPGPSGERRLGVPVGLHPVLAPIVMVQRFHRLVHDVAVVRGRDPDAPPHLTKVTETF